MSTKRAMLRMTGMTKLDAAIQKRVLILEETEAVNTIFNNAKENMKYNVTNRQLHSLVCDNPALGEGSTVARKGTR